MKLTQIELSNFKSWRSLTIPMDAARVLVVGRNGVGKTSIRESVRWALRGVAQGTDAKGAGAEVLIPAGATEARVGVTVAGLGTVRRIFSEKGGTQFGVEGFTGTASAQQQALYDRLGVTPAYVDAVLDSSAFLHLDHADAKALVLALLNVSIAIPGHDRPYGLSELDALYEQAFEARKLAKRDLKALPVLQEPPLPEGGVFDQASIDGQLAKLREQAQALAKQVGGFHATRTAVERALVTATTERTRCQTHLDRIGDIDAVRTELAELTATVQPRVDAPPVPVEVPEGSPKRLAFLKDRRDALAAHKPSEGCVLDPDVRCDTPRQQFGKRVKKLTEEIEAVPVDRLALDPPIAPPDTPFARLLELQGYAQEYANVAARISELTTEIIRLESQIGSLPTTADLDAALTDLQGRIARGEGISKANTAYHAALTRFRASQQAIQTKRTEVETLEATVEALGPSGLRVPALAAQLDRFTAAVNAFTGRFGLAVTFVLQPWMVLVNDRPVETYSKSEQYRIGIAIQLAVAALSGVNFAVIDELDMLDSAGRNVIGRLIHEAPVEQIVILQTREDDAPLPKVPGWLVHRIGKTAEGASVVLESGQA